MKNHEYYKETFDEVQLSEAMLGKVKGFKMEEKNLRKKSKMRYAIAAAAAFVLCFVVSNGIVYAATGDSWVTKVSLYINGVLTEREIIWEQTEDGNVGYFEIDQDDVKVEVEIMEDGEEIPNIGIGFYDSEDGKTSIEMDASYGEE